jgi:hypothetical protein
MTLAQAVARVRKAEEHLAHAQAERDALIRASPESLRALAAQTGLSFQRIAQIRK